MSAQSVSHRRSNSDAGLASKVHEPHDSSSNASVKKLEGKEGLRVRHAENKDRTNQCRLLVRDTEAIRLCIQKVAEIAKKLVPYLGTTDAETVAEWFGTRKDQENFSKLCFEFKNLRGLLQPADAKLKEASIVKVEDSNNVAFFNTGADSILQTVIKIADSLPDYLRSSFSAGNNVNVSSEVQNPYQLIDPRRGLSCNTYNLLLELQAKMDMFPLDQMRSEISRAVSDMGANPTVTKIEEFSKNLAGIVTRARAAIEGANDAYKCGNTNPAQLQETADILIDDFWQALVKAGAVSILLKHEDQEACYQALERGFHNLHQSLEARIEKCDFEEISRVEELKKRGVLPAKAFEDAQRNARQHVKDLKARLHALLGTWHALENNLFGKTYSTFSRDPRDGVIPEIDRLVTIANNDGVPPYRSWKGDKVTCRKKIEERFEQHSQLLQAAKIEESAKESPKIKVAGYLKRAKKAGVDLSILDERLVDQKEAVLNQLKMADKYHRKVLDSEDRKLIPSSPVDDLEQAYRNEKKRAENLQKTFSRIKKYIDVLQEPRKEKTGEWVKLLSGLKILEQSIGASNSPSAPIEKKKRSSQPEPWVLERLGQLHEALSKVRDDIQKELALAKEAIQKARSERKTLDITPLGKTQTRLLTSLEALLSGDAATAEREDLLHRAGSLMGKVSGFLNGEGDDLQKLSVEEQKRQGLLLAQQVLADALAVGSWLMKGSAEGLRAELQAHFRGILESISKGYDLVAFRRRHNELMAQGRDDRSIHGMERPVNSRISRLKKQIKSGTSAPISEKEQMTLARVGFQGLAAKVQDLDAKHEANQAARQEQLESLEKAWADLQALKKEAQKLMDQYCACISPN